MQTEPSIETSARSLHRSLTVVILLAIAVCGAYYPALHGTPLWDDDAHITRPDLRSVHGLRRIWTDFSATQQWYPLLHSAFWFEHRLWGDNPTGYHLTNILLHATSAFLLWLLIRRLGIRGALLAAVVFAVHPVAVESVAWISEQKNTLSTVLYLGAALAYFTFRTDSSPPSYGLATLLFAAALLTKSVTATLPAALLVIVWWREGRLNWRRDVVPLLPWFLASASMAAVTVGVERRFVGAAGSEWTLTFAEKILVAGRALWFYTLKALWPVSLNFMYPRWDLDPKIGWQWLFPVAAVGALALLWKIRRRSRAPLATGLLFVGSLVPALGFFSVYPFRYSFVADHFQHLSLMWLIVGISAGVAAVGTTWPKEGAAATAAAVMLILGFLTWREAGKYRDAETLYRSILVRHPDSWFAFNNLGLLLLNRGDAQQALTLLERARLLNPESEEIQLALALALERSGRRTDAMRIYQRALDADSQNPDAANNLGSLLLRDGRIDASIRHFARALELDPHHPEAHFNMGVALASGGHWDQAATHYRAALAVRPGFTEAQIGLGSALVNVGRAAEAIPVLQEALALEPSSASAEDALGLALAVQGRLDEARSHLETAIRLAPESPEPRLNLANVYFAQDRFDEAVTQYRAAIRLKPTSLAHRRLGIALSRIGRGDEAVRELQAAASLDPLDAGLRFDLAIALLKEGRRHDAIDELEHARRLDPPNIAIRELLSSLRDHS